MNNKKSYSLFWIIIILICTVLVWIFLNPIKNLKQKTSNFSNIIQCKEIKKDEEVIFDSKKNLYLSFYNNPEIWDYSLSLIDKSSSAQLEDLSDDEKWILATINLNESCEKLQKINIQSDILWDKNYTECIVFQDNYIKLKENCKKFLENNSQKEIPEEMKTFVDSCRFFDNHEEYVKYNNILNPPSKTLFSKPIFDEWSENLDKIIVSTWWKTLYSSWSENLQRIHKDEHEVNINFQKITYYDFFPNSEDFYFIWLKDDNYLLYICK